MTNKLPIKNKSIYLELGDIYIYKIRLLRKLYKNKVTEKITKVKMKEIVVFIYKNT